MIRLDSLLSYQEGIHEDLDNKWQQYRRVQVFKGQGLSKALTTKEQETLLKIWRIKKLRPWKLTFREVSTWVKLSERVIDYRKRAQRENARLRNNEFRERLKAAARKGDKVAKERIKAIKKSNRDNMSNMRRKKKEESRSA